jgi:hypothetical protein
MHVFPRLKKVAWLSLFITLLTSTSVFSDHLLITRHFSGVWDMPDHESQGIVLQIGEQEDDVKVGVAYWFTYGEDLQTTWFLGVGPVNGHEINMKLYTGFGVAFMGENVDGDANVEEVGTLDLVFRNCNQGHAVYDTADDLIGSGEFRIKRIISIYHSRCSGGISDDTPSDAKPLQLEVRLHSARDDISGHGKAKFWERADRSDFKVEAEGVPDGVYTLEICSEVEGEMMVADGEGELEYRSPESDAKPLLDFDPRDCLIELLDGDGVALTSGDAVLSEKMPGDKHESDKMVIEIDMDSTGEIEGAEGELEFEIHGDEREFEVEVEHVPAGMYSVWVGGIKVGEVEVAEEDGKTKGKLKFSDPQKDDTLLLDFDPRGEVIEIMAGDTVILDALFPEE